MLYIVGIYRILPEPENLNELYPVAAEDERDALLKSLTAYGVANGLDLDWYNWVYSLKDKDIENIKIQAWCNDLALSDPINIGQPNG